jgi:hypothetical protein
MADAGGTKVSTKESKSFLVLFSKKELLPLPLPFLIVSNPFTVR